MSDGLIINSERYSFALARLAASSKRSAAAVVRSELGLMLTEVAKYTPPASPGVLGRKAEVQGKAKVNADIRSLYGTPGDAYEAIEKKSPAQASAFWFLNENQEQDAAAEIVRSALGRSFNPFDGGQAHAGTGGGKRRRSKSRREHLFYIRNPQSLESYIQQEESHVWWLASGWAPALRALGRKLPYGVGKLSAPGTLKASINDQRIVVTAFDQVSFASDVKGIERRILWAMNFRADTLQRRWDHYLKTLAKENGLTAK